MRDKADETRKRQQHPAPVVNEPPPVDPNDVVPVPVAMEPAEIDERAKVVESLRAETDASREPDSRNDDDSRMEG